MRSLPCLISFVAIYRPCLETMRSSLASGALAERDSAGQMRRPRRRRWWSGGRFVHKNNVTDIIIYMLYIYRYIDRYNWYNHMHYTYAYLHACLFTLHHKIYYRHPLRFLILFCVYAILYMYVIIYTCTIYIYIYIYSYAVIHYICTCAYTRF